jgi:hypothetical protein
VILPSPFAYTQCGIGANNNNICIGINIAVGAVVVPSVHKVRLAPNLASGAVLRRSDANKMNVHYVIPSKRVARLGAAICGRESGAVQLLFSRKRLVIRNIDALNLGLPFDFAARRWARFGLVSCIWFPFNGGDIASDRDALGVPTASNT